MKCPEPEGSTTSSTTHLLKAQRAILTPSLRSSLSTWEATKSHRTIGPLEPATKRSSDRQTYRPPSDRTCKKDLQVAWSHSSRQLSLAAARSCSRVRANITS